MKLRFYPKKANVLGMLGHRLAEIQAAEVEAKDTLKALEAKASIIHNPYAERELLGAKADVEEFARQEADLQDKIGLLESHDPPEVMVELEL